MSNIGNRQTMSNNLKYYLRLKGKSRKEVCNELKLSYSTFCDWVNGNKYPRIDKIELLANYFNVQKSDLIEDKDSKPSDNDERWCDVLDELELTADEINQVIKFAQYLKTQRNE